MFPLKMPLRLGISHDFATIPLCPPRLPLEGFICPVAEMHSFQAAYSLALPL